LIGVLSQFVLLPAITLGLVWVIAPLPSVGLGMILVAACPGGNISNFISLLARGNAALSVGLTAVATMLASFMTPFNFAFWASLYPPTATMLKQISIDPVDMLVTVLLLLGVPLIAGMWTTYRFPKFSARVRPYIRVSSIVIFIGFVVGALYTNFEAFLQYIEFIVLIVLVHNGMALLTGYTAGRLGRLPQPDVRTITIETGIQNSGLALILIFGFFNGLGGMAIIAAWWGVWHILAGLAIAGVWSRIQINNAVTLS
jgi:BASS family bile acid:Na+ symporter